MKDKRYKSIEEVIDHYIRLKDEQIEIPLHITKAKEKHEAFLKKHENEELKSTDAQNAFKNFLQIKKYEESKSELNDQLLDVENIFKEFLQSLNGNKISYEKKDDSKSKITFLFWLEGSEVKSNRL